jgi:hypothetical protein
MRTKTLALSTVLGALGSASSLMAQTNVYSLNAVGYINVTLPPGYCVITCPLICSPDNTLNTLFPNGNGVNTPPSGIPYAGATVYQFAGGHFTAGDSGAGVYAYGGWVNGGADVTLNPGQAVFFNNPNAGNMTATFVGTVPTGSLTNVLTAGYNLVGSMVPVSGDIANTNTAVGAIANLNVTPGYGDFVSFFLPGGVGFNGPQNPTEGGPYSPGWGGGAGATGGPLTTNVSQGFFYYNGQGSGTENWIENFTINP